MIILDLDRWSASTTVVVGTSEATALPATNTQQPDRANIWRSLVGSGEAALDADFGSVVSIDMIAVANVKRLSGGSLQLQDRGTGTTAGTASTVATITPATDDETGVVVQDVTSFTARHVRLLWTNPESVSDYAECGVVGIGAGFEPTQDLQWNWPTSRVDPSVRVQAPGGQVTVTQRPAYTTGSWRFLWETAADLDRLRAFYRRVGTHTPFFFAQGDDFSTVVRPDWVQLFARLTGARGLVGITPGVFDVQLEWEEVR